ncbi:hypothetical protein OE88DRAFT_1259077 [Heliocybe sulcata]|uniref:Uncharacterized protein n=1 Tax=Heliocybe sulcata TaxID=5364 RepID=A0A5C3N894_9AGAM|nr:hypothetical protein OE88DRAFT_1259077 [Heliocybe sulcata]
MSRSLSFSFSSITPRQWSASSISLTVYCLLEYLDLTGSSSPHRLRLANGALGESRVFAARSTCIYLIWYFHPPSLPPRLLERRPWIPPYSGTFFSYTIPTFLSPLVSTPETIFSESELYTRCCLRSSRRSLLRSLYVKKLTVCLA